MHSIKLIVRAYAILRDPELRQQYDLGGDAAVEYYLKHAREKPGIREVWKWDFLAPWNNSSKELPSLSEMFRRASQYDLYTRLEHAVAMGQPELPNVREHFNFNHFNDQTNHSNNDDLGSC